MQAAVTNSGRPLASFQVTPKFYLAAMEKTQAEVLIPCNTLSRTGNGGLGFRNDGNVPTQYVASRTSNETVNFALTFCQQLKTLQVPSHY